MLYRAKNLVIDNSRELQIGFGSFEFKKNTLTIIKGESGIGKTTLLKVLGLLSRNISLKSEITLFIKGEESPLDLKTISWKKKEYLRGNYFAYIFQDDHLIDSINVRDNILFPSLLSGDDRTLIKERLYKMLKKPFLRSIKNRLNDSCAVLSGGEKKKVALLRAMLKDPDILIADEPWTNLGGDLKSGDVKEYVEFFIEQRENKSTILATHNEDVIEKYKKAKYVDAYELVEMKEKGTLRVLKLELMS